MPVKKQAKCTLAHSSGEPQQAETLAKVRGSWQPHPGRYPLREQKTIHQETSLAFGSLASFSRWHCTPQKVIIHGCMAFIPPLWGRGKWAK